MTRRRIFTAIAYLVLLVVIDRALGLVLWPLFDRSRPSKSCASPALDAIDRRDLPVLFLGSSRTRHQLDPVEFERATGLPSFNAGCNGASVLTTRMIEELVLQQDPEARLFLMVLDPKDLYLDPRPKGFPLSPVAHESVLDRFVSIFDAGTRIKLQSWAYRYNGVALKIALESFASPTRDPDGFTPLVGNMTGEAAPERHPGGIPAEIPPDQPFLEFQEQAFVEFTRRAREHGIEVAWIMAPRLRLGVARSALEVRANERLRELARESGATLIDVDEIAFPVFERPDLYKDHSHLNGEGARIFTREVAELLLEQGIVGKAASSFRLSSPELPSDG